MSVSKRQNGNWRVRYSYAGKKHSKDCGKGREGKRLAEALDLEIKMRKKRGEDLSGMISNDPYLGEIAQAYFDVKKLEGKSEDWIKQWATNFNNNFLPTLNQIPASQITMQFLNRFMLDNYGHRTVATRNRYFGYLRAMFSFAVENDYIEKSPMAKWKRAKETPHRVTITVDQLARIKAEAPEHLKWIIDVAFNTGVRTGKSELLRLEWDKIDWEKKLMHVYATKTKTWRSIPLSDSFLEQLFEKKKVAQAETIIEYNGRSISNYSKSFRKACERAGIEEGVISYCVRHLFCTTLLSSSAEIGCVSRMMGHSTIKHTVDTYYHPQEAEKFKAINMLPKI